MTRSIAKVLLKLAIVVAVWLFLTRHPSVPEGSLLAAAQGPWVTRAEVLKVAREYAEHAWQPSRANIRHGNDRHGVAVDTPDDGSGNAKANRWHPGQMNLGVPYKWGGFDTPESFDAGVQAGQAAGDLYRAGKRRAGDSSVSEEAVGIDCSGFISRCWKLPEKLGTATLPGLCHSIHSSDLQPGDIMDLPQQHVLLFAKWLNASKTRALFYEAEGDHFGRVVASERNLWALWLLGAKPLRYGRIWE